MSDRKPTTSLIGHAGEHYVIYQLYQRGYLAALAPMGTDTSDVLVLASDGASPGCAVQVKTRTGGGRRREWIMKEKHESLARDRLLYVFVDLGMSPPECFVVPSRVIATAVARNHKAWLAGPSSRVTTRKDNPMRKISSTYPQPVPGYPAGWLDEWRDRWDLIEAALANRQYTGDADNPDHAFSVRCS